MAVQLDPQNIGLFDTENANSISASIVCQDLGIPCQMGSFVSVSEIGELLVLGTSGDVYHVTGNLVNGVTPSVERLPGQSVGWAMLSRDGLLAATTRVDGSGVSVIRFLARQENGPWGFLGDEIEEDLDLDFTGTGVLSEDGYTSGFAFCDKVNQEECFVKVYRYADGRGWFQLGDTIAAKSSPSISMSYDASALSVADASDSFRTLYFSPRCASDESYYRVFIIVGADQSIDWTLESNGSTLTSPNYPTGYRRKILEEICLPRGICSNLNVVSNSVQSSDESLLSVIVDDVEQLNVAPIANATYAVGDCTN
uniref:Uncharacterized protein n=2 Tax=Entomoneis paludosa TaxID=265537 RepID=A0A7S3DPY3_9STRA|mmetsp:Transcript_2671/g.5433  ORF Transcript_2671/g.5433 Transcript_2671/m.5433 type:complete len:312 (+) Transcript_2671:711-1646(+)